MGAKAMANEELAKVKQLVTDLDERNIKVDAAVGRGTYTGDAKEKLKTYMFNNRKLIYSKLKEYTEIKEQYDMMVEALEDADARVDKLEALVKKLQSELKESRGDGAS